MYFTLYFFFFTLIIFYLKNSTSYILKQKLKLLNKEEIEWLKNRGILKIYKDKFEKCEIIDSYYNNFYLSVFNMSNLKIFSDFKKISINYNKEKYFFYIALKKFYD